MQNTIEIKSARDVIVAAVQKAGMPLSVLSRRSGVEYSAVCRGLAPNGSGRIIADEFIRYCAVLGLELSDFVQAQRGESANAVDAPAENRA